MSKLISISLNPNIQSQDIRAVWRALLCIFFPQKADAEISAFEKIFAHTFADGYEAITFYAGRTTWYAILKALGVGEGDEVLVPAFTCVAVINPILWVGAKPVFVDISDDYLMDLADAQKKVSKRTKVILAQHTFGLVCDMDAYRDFADKHEVALVEDCAHAVGASYQGQPVGTLSDAAFFSFGRDKCLSAGSGGAVVSDDSEFMYEIAQVRASFRSPAMPRVLQDVLYILFIEGVYLGHRISPLVGKLLHKSFLLTGCIRRANSFKEKHNTVDSSVLRKWHGAFAALGQVQLAAYAETVRHRKGLVAKYNQALGVETGADMPLLRYPYRVKDAADVLRHFAKKNVYLGDWYNQVIGPKGVDLASSGYSAGSCPRAEKISSEIVNLPTNVRVDAGEAEDLVKELRMQETLNS